MSVVSVTEIASRRSSMELQRLGRVYTRTFQVITDSTLTTSLEVKFATGIPSLYPFPDYYAAGSEYDTAALVSRVEANQPDRDDPYLWHVEVEYATRSSDPAFQSGQSGSGGSGGGPPENPLARPIRVQFSDVHRSVSFDRPLSTSVQVREVDGETCDGTLISTVTLLGVHNVNGEPFDPVPEIDVIDTAITVQRNEVTFDPVIADGNKNCINEDVFAGFAARAVKVMGISATNEFEQGMQYWAVTYRFEVRTCGWDKYIINAGRYSLKDGAQPNDLKNRQLPEADAGQGTGGLVRLNEIGEALGDDEATMLLKFRAYPEINFQETFQLNL